MRTFTVFAIALLISTQSFAGITLTKKQFENLDVIHEALQKTDTNFIGLNGSRKNMQVIGMSDEQANQIINALDIDAAKAKLPKNKKKARILADLQQLNLTQETIDYLMGVN